jgi:signal transduction histidine kinase
MTLKSALEDLTHTTLDAISGCLKRLEYLAGLRRSRDDYSHWGFAKVHGESTAKKAIHEAHRAAISEVLSTPLATLLNDAEMSSGKSGNEAEEYLEGLARQEKHLLPNNPGAGSARHLSSVLNALLGLERHRIRRATRRAS